MNKNTISSIRVPTNRFGNLVRKFVYCFIFGCKIRTKSLNFKKILICVFLLEKQFDDKKIRRTANLQMKSNKC